MWERISGVIQKPANFSIIACKVRRTPSPPVLPHLRLKKANQSALAARAKKPSSPIEAVSLGTKPARWMLRLAQGPVWRTKTGRSGLGHATDTSSLAGPRAELAPPQARR